MMGEPPKARGTGPEDIRLVKSGQPTEAERLGTPPAKGPAPGGGPSPPPSAPTAPQWKGDTIILPKGAFDALQLSLQVDGQHIQLGKAPKEVTAHRGEKVERLKVPAGYGLLQIDGSFT